MKQSHKNAVTVVGAEERAIEGEYLGKGAAVAGTVAISTFSGSLFAAVPASVTTGISDAVTDVSTIGAAILGVVIVIAAFAWLRRVIH